MSIYVAHDSNGKYGDWVVKQGGSTVSNHRKKSKALEKARKLQSDETIFVQNAKGEFQRKILS